MSNTTLTPIAQLTKDIHDINAMVYVPSAIKMQMVMLRVRWFEAHCQQDWRTTDDAYRAFAELMLEWALPSIPNEESSLYAVALQTAADK